MKANNSTGLLFIGYFLSGKGVGRCVCEDLSKRFEDEGYLVFRTSFSTNRFIRILEMAFTIIAKRNHYQAAYVEVYNGLAFIWAEITCALLRILSKPYVITLHGARMVQFAERWPRRVRLLLQRADVVTTPSRLFAERFSTWRPDILYLPNAIDLSNYDFIPRSRIQPNLCWLRKFESIYNPPLAIVATKMLLQEFPIINLTMGGAIIEGESFRNCESIISKYNLESNIQLPGFIKRSEIRQWFNKSDIYLNTTFVESFGIAVMEAAACGLCIVTTNVGELPYLWEDGVDALLVPPNDPDAMAAAVKRILSEPGLAERLSKNARKKAEQFDWSVILPQWEKLIEEVIEN